jgi:hypothetical protein
MPIHQTKVRNDPFGYPNFSLEVHSIYFIYFLFERACQDAEHYRGFCFISHFFEETGENKSDIFKKSVFLRGFRGSFLGLGGS